MNGSATRPASRPTPDIAFRNDEPAFHLLVTLKRSEDHEADIHRIGKIYAVLTQYAGQDHFSLFVVNGGDGVRLDFPNDTTRYCLSLLNNLEEIVGRDAVEVQAVRN